jgi:CRISPR-associated protein Csd2
MSLQRRYDFVLFFDVQDGNPNGDPDAGNLPRVDPETGQGLVTDVCLKRKLRNYVSLARAGQSGFSIFVTEGAVLNRAIAEVRESVDVQATVGQSTRGDDRVELARRKMCEVYYDVRTFGAVMSTGANAGQVRGPVQLTFGRSINSITVIDHSITRVAATAAPESGSAGGAYKTMGRKGTVPYALYRAHGFVSPALAARTGFLEDDLHLLWSGLEEMFEHDRSAAHGLMSTRALIIFEHCSPLGNAPAYSLFRRVTVARTRDPARVFDDYTIELDGKPLHAVRTIVRVGKNWPD